MELTLLDQITNAVRARVHHLPGGGVRGQRLHPRQGRGHPQGIRLPGCHVRRPPNAHTPETFADALAHQAMKEVSAILAAGEKRDRKAAKRMAAG